MPRKYWKKKMNEEQFETIERVINALARNFTFDIYDIDDIGQEIYIICMEILSDYDSECTDTVDVSESDISDLLSSDDESSKKKKKRKN